MMVRPIVVGIWTLALVVCATLFTGLFAQMDALVLSSPFLPLFPILGLYWLNPKEELAGWALFTIWLGSTYLTTGLIQEYLAFAFIIVFAILGYFRSSWFLVAAWYGHILWDFLPRDLPPLLEDLPLACLIFDGLIGSFIAWRALTHRWSQAVAEPGYQNDA